MYRPEQQEAIKAEYLREHFPTNLRKKGEAPAEPPQPAPGGKNREKKASGGGSVKIISGGQTGVDQAALQAAHDYGLPTGGYVAKGCTTEDGPSPWLKAYGLVECPRPGYPARTAANVKAADATLILCDGEPTGGTLLTVSECNRQGKPYCLVQNLTAGPDSPHWPTMVKGACDFLETVGVQTLNVAGPRESKAPGIYKLAVHFLMDLFAGLPAVKSGPPS